MAHEIRCSTLALTLDAVGRPRRLHHRHGGLDLLVAAENAAGMWELGLIRPVSFDDPLPPVVEPPVPYEGHEWWANRLEYQADLTLTADASPTPEIVGDVDGLTLTWRVPLPSASGALGGAVHLATVVLDIVGGPTVSALECRVRVDLDAAAGWTIKRVVAPRLRGFGDLAAPSQDAVLYPLNWGVLRHNPLADASQFTGAYPSGMCWGQLTAWLHGEHGVYLAIRDPDSHHTGLDVQYVEGTAPAPIEVQRWYLSHHGEAAPANPAATPLAARVAAGRQPAMQLQVGHWPTMGTSWSSPYPVRLEGFSGGWRGAAELHRGWATQQRWCRRGPLHTRADAPTSLAGIDLWFTRYGFHPGGREITPPDALHAAMIRLHDYFGVPYGLHYYHWHNFSWHSAFPRHAPPVPGFEAVVADLQARGIVIMPYCQGRLLYRDRPALDTERSHAAIEHNGQPYLEMYTPQDDWPLALCPASPWAQQQWHEAARLLWRNYGVAGVYFDQISAMPPNLCYHRGHGHALGGGTYYVEAYREALGKMAPMIAEDTRRFLSSECMADAFMDSLDLYLAFVPPLEDYVPLFPAIYGGYTTAMGRATPDSVMQNLQLFAIAQGEQLLFGGQLGWFDERILKHPEAAALLKDYVYLRSGLRDFLHVGEMAPDVPLTVDGERVAIALPAGACGRTRDVVLDREAICSTGWRSPDGRRLILLLNESTRDAEVTVHLSPDLAARHWERRDSLGAGQGGSANAQRIDLDPLATELRVIVAPYHVVALVQSP